MDGIDLRVSATKQFEFYNDFEKKMEIIHYGMTPRIIESKYLAQFQNNLKSAFCKFQRSKKLRGNLGIFATENETVKAWRYS